MVICVGRCLLTALSSPATSFYFIRTIVALALTFASAAVIPVTNEYAVYGNTGLPQQNWQSREVAGWPAPYLADDPGTSVIHQIGLEDELRYGPFIATLSFWFLVTLLLARLIRKLKGPSGQNSSRRLS